ncbi:hypothetical protein [Sphingosinicella humi]|uniref:Antifreeze protein n=1 Tax=Allosphingosinicella humi TaxID=2068657 RepID=A0A2U2J483_9SPHN|nr:hypothetical protein [Sphingosinicella humi]PWG03156.1 hypothetical protein DF286_09975 [Sphingosinicella humi]
MRKFSKILTGAAAAALVTLTAAAPAQAQWRHYDRDNGIDIGDIAAGVAIIGGAALAIDALTKNDRYDRYDRYGRTYGGYYDGYGYRDAYYGPQASVNACARTAQRYGARVEITDVDRRGYNGYRVRGRTYVRDYNYGRWGRGYDYDRESFTCYAENGRVYDFRI